MTTPNSVLQEFDDQLNDYIANWKREMLAEYSKDEKELRKCGGEGGKPGPCPDPQSDTAHGDKPASSSEAKKSGAIPKLKASAANVKESAKAMAGKLGKKVWDKMPKKVQKTLAVTHHYGSKVYHALEAPIHAGKKLAMQVARERGLPEAHVEKVGKWVGILDGVGNWVHYAPAGHHVGHVLGLASWASFGAAKAAMVTPWAALAYIGYSAARCPGCVYSAARKAVKGELGLFSGGHKAQDAAGKAKYYTDADIEAAFTSLNKVDEDKQDWYEALVIAAMDQTRDLGKAIEIADAVLKKPT